MNGSRSAVNLIFSVAAALVPSASPAAEAAVASMCDKLLANTVIENYEIEIS